MKDLYPLLPGHAPVPPDDETPELLLMAQIANRDAACFAELRNRLAGAIYNTAYRVLNNPSEAEEVAQDVFLQIWDKAPLYEPKRGKPITWAATMARNRAIDRLRANRRRYRLRDEFKAELETAEPARHPDALQFAKTNDDARVVRQAVAQLTPNQKEAIELVYFEGLTQREAAEQLHQPLGAVKARIRRGLGKLRETTPEML